VSITDSLLGSIGESWTEDAACQAADVDLFFSNDEDDQRRALEMCKSCPVQEPCLRFALEHGEMYGIWGGLTESDRRSLIREQRRESRERRRREERREAA
jgi:WhiB family transcriptional regulator, redox-sensing transcriptional regulator